jgi:hypothetical protein
LFKFNPTEKLISSTIPLIGKIFNSIKININDFNFSEALFLFDKMIGTLDSKIIEKFVELRIYEHLIDYISVKTNVNDLQCILAILGNLIYQNSKFSKQFYHLDILEKLANFLSDSMSENNKATLNKHSQLYKDICWILNNLTTANLKVEAHFIRDTKLPNLLLNMVYSCSNSSLLCEVISIFRTLLDSSQDNIKTEMLRLQILELFYNNLYHTDPEIVLMCLEGIKKFLEFGKKIMRDRNIVFLELLQEGISIKLEQLYNSKNQDISQLSQEIISEYFQSELEL